MGEASRRLWIRVPRSALALLFFLAFGVGGLVLGCLLFPPLALFRARRAMRALVRACYRLFVWAARATGMIRVVLSAEDRARLAAMRGCVVVASHPTLIDVVVLLSLLPDATAVAPISATTATHRGRRCRRALDSSSSCGDAVGGQHETGDVAYNVGYLAVLGIADILQLRAAGARGKNPETGRDVREVRYRLKDNYTRFYLK